MKYFVNSKGTKVYFNNFMYELIAYYWPNTLWIHSSEQDVSEFLNLFRDNQAIGET